MPFLKPSDSVHKIISMPRWQRDWLNSHPTIKFSTIIQHEIIMKMIQEKDLKYYEKFVCKKVELVPDFITEEKFKDKVIKTDAEKKKIILNKN